MVASCIALVPFHTAFTCALLPCSVPLCFDACCYVCHMLLSPHHVGRETLPASCRIRFKSSCFPLSTSALAVYLGLASEPLYLPPSSPLVLSLTFHQHDRTGSFAFFLRPSFVSRLRIKSVLRPVFPLAFRLPSSIFQVRQDC
jgi:hypothetical protein